MGQTLTNGIYLPNEGERNCYSGLAANWNAVDTLKGNYSLHAINVDIHVTAAEKETWNGKADNSALTAHTGDTTIHVTAEDKAAWNGKADASALTAHTGDTTIHVTAEDKAKWDAVTSKADDSDVVHKSGNETINGNKTFSSINGVEPSSLSLPSDRSARIDISSYITNLGNGNDNIYTVPANGYIYLYFTSINGVLCYSQTPGRLTNYAQTFTRYQGEGQLYAFFPVRKGDTLVVKIYTSSTAEVQSAYFIPCQGNV